MKLIRILVVGIVFAISSCASNSSSNSQSQPDVVASFYPIYDVVASVGGSALKVTNLTPAGAEPHDLELSPQQVDQINSADLVFYLGDGFQPAVEKAIKQSDARVVDLLEVVSSKSADPHIWLDPRLMRQVVIKVQTELTNAQRSGERGFSRNALAYEKRLSVLDSKYEQGLAQCSTRILVTAHEAFGHLAKRYALDQQSISGPSPESESNPSRLAELIDVVKQRNISTVFYETLVPEDLARTLAREAQVNTAVLNPIEGLTTSQTKSGDDYFSLMNQNLIALKKGLGCE